ncbi:DUF4180 domain-containing protein [Sphingobacterium haloxyli]|uniref:DUF4180 domain-containing protein n=1 Tax=Sphingobacterium haloxyli TaxID=2100533 RepID=A0A2S9J4L0_9SPHI|nr:DUF4180 domain-containing protein [Sphingobacterium haloxyli]PRD47728.1 DUF4180 domain-containing protein [Sphingobacterium haloxyli]
MKIVKHQKNNIQIAEIISDEIIIHDTETALDLLGNIYYQGFDKVILHEKNITPSFFDLKTKVAGDILQKFAQYRMPIAIIGAFSKYQSNSLNEFIYETNKTGYNYFAATREEVLQNFCKE